VKIFFATTRITWKSATDFNIFIRKGSDAYYSGSKNPFTSLMECRFLGPHDLEQESHLLYKIKNIYLLFKKKLNESGRVITYKHKHIILKIGFKNINKNFL